MIIILYLSVALIAVAFLILVIYLSKTLKSVQMTLTNVASTLDGLEGQMKGITAETTELLHKTKPSRGRHSGKIREIKYGCPCCSGSGNFRPAV